MESRVKNSRASRFRYRLTVLLRQSNTAHSPRASGACRFHHLRNLTLVDGPPATRRRPPVISGRRGNQFRMRQPGSGPGLALVYFGSSEDDPSAGVFRMDETGGNPIRIASNGFSPALHLVIDETYIYWGGDGMMKATKDGCEVTTLVENVNGACTGI